MNSDDTGRKLFGQGAQKNPRMKQAALAAAKGNCAECSKPIREKFVLHHETYDHACTYLRTTKVDTGKRIRTVPDCARCETQQPAAFAQCLEKLKPLHGYCHVRHHANDGHSGAAIALRHIEKR